MSVRAQRIIVLVGLLVAALALSVPAVSAGVSQTIHAYFDADGHLMFTYVDGSSVGAPGTYQVTYDNFGADDLADDHAFHLSGPDRLRAACDGRAVDLQRDVPGERHIHAQDDLSTIGRRLFVARSGRRRAGHDDNGRGVVRQLVRHEVVDEAVSSDIVGSAITPFRGTSPARPARREAFLSFKGKTVSRSSPVGTRLRSSTRLRQLRSRWSTGRSSRLRSPESGSSAHTTR